MRFVATPYTRYYSWAILKPKYFETSKYGLWNLFFCLSFWIPSGMSLRILPNFLDSYPQIWSRSSTSCITVAQKKLTGRDVRWLKPSHSCFTAPPKKMWSLFSFLLNLECPCDLLGSTKSEGRLVLEKSSNFYFSSLGVQLPCCTEAQARLRSGKLCGERSWWRRGRLWCSGSRRGSGQCWDLSYHHTHGPKELPGSTQLAHKIMRN